MAEIVPEQGNSATENMDAVYVQSLVDDCSRRKEPVTNGEAKMNRPRDDDVKAQQSDDVGEKVKIENSGEETCLESLRSEEADKVRCGSVRLGPKSFKSAVEMFDYFFKFLHYWPTHLNVNKYEQMVLRDLIKKGHPKAVKKIGVGIRSFQVRYHRKRKSRCFFLIREDGSIDSFSFKKCVAHILPLPEDMKSKLDSIEALGGGSGGEGRGHKRGTQGRKSFKIKSWIRNRLKNLFPE